MGLMNQGAVDVKKVGSEYWLVAEGHSGVFLYTSPDGTSWTQATNLGNSLNLYVLLSGEEYDKEGMITPMLFLKDDTLHSLWYAGASYYTWNKNSIAVAFIGD